MTTKITKKATKTESLTVRIHPQIKYALELLSRKQHRSLTGVVEWGLSKILQNELSNAGINLEDLYHTQEIERIRRLGDNHHDLLTWEELEVYEGLS